MVLAELTIQGRSRKVLLQAPKNGFFYVLDRSTGRLISAEAYSKVTWAQRIDRETGRPIEIDNLRFGAGPVTFWPSSAGAHSFQPMSFNPHTGLVYIPTMKLGVRIGPATSDADLKAFQDEHRRYFPTLAVKAELVVQDPDDGTAGLLAWDPLPKRNGGRCAIRIASGMGHADHGRQPCVSGHWARCSHRLRCDERSSALELRYRFGIVAAPSTYEVDGMQYVAVLVGYGGSAGNGASSLTTGGDSMSSPDGCWCLR